MEAYSIKAEAEICSW